MTSCVATDISFIRLGVSKAARLGDPVAGPARRKLALRRPQFRRTLAIMPESPFIEALLHTARKRCILDRGQAARLHVLMHAQSIHDPKTARAWILSSGLVTARTAQMLLERLPKADQPPYGTYVPLVHLADGGMGSVYLAADVNGKLVVIKTMRGNLAGNTEVVHRFQRETRYMMELKHPNIVACLDQGQASNGELFLVLEFEPSGDLKELTTQHHGLYEAIGLGMIYQIADALTLAHQKQLVHRDIKPPNIFVSYEGRAKLADFGIARSTNEQRTMLTMQGALVGSPYYMSPEQVLADPNLDIRCDIYALGAVLFYCITGTEPYKGSLQEVLHAHRTAPIPDICLLKPDISARTSAIIQRCMQKKRDDRFADPAALRQAVLEAIAALETPGAPVAVLNDADRLAATMDQDFSQAAHQEQPASRNSSIVTAGAITVATMATLETATGQTPATLVAPGDFQATMAMSPTDWAQVAPDAERLEGDPAKALTAPWLALTGDGACILLYARTSVSLGKICEPPVDICLRKYPTLRFRDDCLRISRQHLRLELRDSAVSLTDLGSGNGTVFDGKAMPVNAGQVLSPGQDHQVMVAGALALRLHVHARQGKATVLAGGPQGDFPCGLERDLPVDAVVLERVDNRSDMIYALVTRRVSLGRSGSGAMICLPNAGPPLEFALHGGRWLWRSTLGIGPWAPLTADTRISTGSMALTARPGSYELFQ